MTVSAKILERLDADLSPTLCRYLSDSTLLCFYKAVPPGPWPVFNHSWGEKIVCYVGEHPNGITAQVYQAIHKRVPIELTAKDKANERAKWLYRQVSRRARQAFETQRQVLESAHVSVDNPSESFADFYQFDQIFVTRLQTIEKELIRLVQQNHPQILSKIKSLSQKLQQIFLHLSDLNKEETLLFFSTIIASVDLKSFRLAIDRLRSTENRGIISDLLEKMRLFKLCSLFFNIVCQTYPLETLSWLSLKQILTNIKDYPERENVMIAKFCSVLKEKFSNDSPDFGDNLRFDVLKLTWLAVIRSGRCDFLEEFLQDRGHCFQEWALYHLDDSLLQEAFDHGSFDVILNHILMLNCCSSWELVPAVLNCVVKNDASIYIRKILNSKILNNPTSFFIRLDSVFQTAVNCGRRNCLKILLECKQLKTFSFNDWIGILNAVKDSRRSDFGKMIFEILTKQDFVRESFLSEYDLRYLLRYYQKLCQEGLESSRSSI